MWMAPNKPHDNGRFRPFLNFRLPIDGLTGSVLPPILGASEERWLEPERQCFRLTHTIGWVHSEALAMGITVAN
jgi:hypothetical protein